MPIRKVSAAASAFETKLFFRERQRGSVCGRWSKSHHFDVVTIESGIIGKTEKQCNFVLLFACENHVVCRNYLFGSDVLHKRHFGVFLKFVADVGDGKMQFFSQNGQRDFFLYVFVDVFQYRRNHIVALLFPFGVVVAQKQHNFGHFAAV